jgi:hypothetical protein
MIPFFIPEYQSEADMIRSRFKIRTKLEHGRAVDPVGLRDHRLVGLAQREAHAGRPGGAVADGRGHDHRNGAVFIVLSGLSNAMVLSRGAYARPHRSLRHRAALRTAKRASATCLASSLFQDYIPQRNAAV